MEDEQGIGDVCYPGAYCLAEGSWVLRRESLNSCGEDSQEPVSTPHQEHIMGMKRLSFSTVRLLMQRWLVLLTFVLVVLLLAACGTGGGKVATIATTATTQPTLSPTFNETSLPNING